MGFRDTGLPLPYFRLKLPALPSFMLVAELRLDLGIVIFLFSLGDASPILSAEDFYYLLPGGEILWASIDLIFGGDFILASSLSID